MRPFLQNGVTAVEPKRKEHDEAGLANNPFPSTPPGMMGSGYAITALAADPNRAFQTINADTLEQASKTTEIQEPSQAVSALAPACLIHSCSLSVHTCSDAPHLHARWQACS